MKPRMLMPRIALLIMGFFLLPGLIALALGLAPLAMLFGILAVIAPLSMLVQRQLPTEPEPTSLLRFAPVDRPARGQSLISLVLLRRKPRYLDASVVARLASEAWGIPIGLPGEAQNYVAGGLPSFILTAGRRTFLVNSFAMPYFPGDAKVTGDGDEPGVRAAVAEHRAWISVDLLGDEELDFDEAYRWIGRLVAALSDDHTLAVFSPELCRIVDAQPACHVDLLGPEPLALFTRASESRAQLCPDDPRLARAILQARRQWPQFLEAFELRSDSQRFSIRAPLLGGDGQPAWMNITAIENGVIYGRPSAATDTRRTLRAAVRNVMDWTYTEGSGLRGGFTIEAARRQK